MGDRAEARRPCRREDAVGGAGRRQSPAGPPRRAAPWRIAASATSGLVATATARALPEATISSSARRIASSAISSGAGIVQRIEIDMLGAEPPQALLERAADELGRQWQLAVRLRPRAAQRAAQAGARAHRPPHHRHQRGGEAAAGRGRASPTLVQIRTRSRRPRMNSAAMVSAAPRP